MGRNAVIPTVRGLMLAFAERTGLSANGKAPRRYLWTDAHAVCNFLSLYGATGRADWLDLALALVDQVHSVLGRHRADDRRSGWISGLPEDEGRNHPTAGGLRIGKPLPERGPRDRYDDRLEWDRDGQYYHYLTKWMHALARVAAVSGDPRYCRWAIELASAAHAGFTLSDRTGAPGRLAWKMSIDLSYPLIPSSGQHDPLDGFITCHELRACAHRLGDAVPPGFDGEIAGVAAMLEGRYWQTDDPLGIGGLLFDLSRVAQMRAAVSRTVPDILSSLARAAAESVAYYAAHAGLSKPADYRLAFRELGLSIGLHGVPIINRVLAEPAGPFPDSVQNSLKLLERNAAMAATIESFWCDPGNQRGYTWRDHEDINSVMLATSLLPGEYLAV